MKIQIENDQPVIDAQDLGPLLGLHPAEVQAKMRSGHITSTYEVGQGEDAGRFRLTFFHAGKRVRLTCNEDGDVISKIRTDTGTRT
ncbi:DUF6522 family protein [Octadecabacter sp. G9-8]|uniref:DUF6522 family protein n=1 Tax=Octadecabacter dasysiphoniae TaxID=2909341 RepID=A0ABS9CT36_9RHOB|nr:DUF6522 family protein [Octadecabacter dasysiphoniae]MCF2870343.1 DUF6522 family protein [Octadecabacter dasysiphoniae]